MDEFDFINCRYCGRKIHRNAPACENGCGAPNSPEPLPWYSTMGLRVKAALKSKQESVWADRLASLMPPHFLFALYTLYLGAKLGLMGTLGFFVVLISAFVLLFIVMYYPDWYKETPERRKNSGQMYFIFILLHALVVFFLF